MTQTVSAAKERMRSELLLKRRTLDPEPWRMKSREACRRLEGLEALRHALSVHCYISMDGEREVSTRDLLEWLCSERKAVYVPYGGKASTGAARYPAGACLMPSCFGPPVPEGAMACDVQRYDVVIVPLVGFDRAGGRIGFGKGWYDRFFRSLDACGNRPLRIGLAFAMQQVDKVPCDPWDERLDLVVTEDETINCMMPGL